MRTMAVGTVLTLGAAAAIYFTAYTEPNVYPMQPAQVYDILKKAEFGSEFGGKDASPFGTMKVSASGTPNQSVTYNARGSHGGFRCEVFIAPEADEKSRLDVSCEGGGAGSGVASGMLANMTRKQLIEFIDANLEGRPYDPTRYGATSTGWPEDRVKHDNIIQASGKAIQMEADIKAAQREYESSKKSSTSDDDWYDGDEDWVSPSNTAY